MQAITLLLLDFFSSMHATYSPYIISLFLGDSKEDETGVQAAGWHCSHHW